MTGSRPILIRALVVAAAISATACGGSGSGSSGTDGRVVVVPGTPTPSPSPSPSASASDSGSALQQEDARSNAALLANAAAAYNAGATGRGIKIAVLDTGITPTVSEFAGRIDPASADVGGSRGLVDANGHGTWMSSIALAARDGRGMHGLAFEATLISFNVSRPSDCTVQRCPVYSVPVAAGIDAAIAAGARVINMSFSTDQVDDGVIAAVRRAAAAGIVMVIAAGNETASEPLLLSRAVADAGAGHVIIAGAHDATGRPYAFNNRAGTGPAASSYLMAPGVDINVTGNDGGVLTFSGTSPATAAISGAAALVAQARPKLSGAQIVSLLLRTATDAGAAGRDPVYGNGILNIGAALSADGTGG